MRAYQTYQMQEKDGCEKICPLGTFVDFENLPDSNAEHAERFRYAMAKRPPMKRKKR